MFIMLVRIFFTNTVNHSVQYFKQEDYQTRQEMIQAATARYHNILAADLQNETVTYNACYMIDDTGYVMDKDVFPRNAEE